MLKLSQLFEAKACNSAETSQESSHAYQASSYSSVSAGSTPVSPVVSLFSSRGHSRFSSSVSSLRSSSGMGISMEGSGLLRKQLREVKEEPVERVSNDEIESDYFQHFEQYYPPETYPDEAYSSTLDSDGYDLTDKPLYSIPQSPTKRRRSESLSSRISSRSRGLSRIGTRISTMSARWRSKHASCDGAYVEETLGDDLRSRANSASSTINNPISRVTSISQSPARTSYGPRTSNSSVLPIDIEKANRQSVYDLPQASTPLLPPLLSGHSSIGTNSPVQSPLQSPSVADVTDEFNLAATSTSACVSIHPSPPLSTKPSMASMNRPRANTVRTVSGDGPPVVLTDPGDEWAHKLGHANFTIQPEPYVVETCDVDSFRQFRTDWDLARCNYAKHLVRTGEHYGVTSKIYQLTEEKWRSIDSEWKRNYESMIAKIGVSKAAALGLTTSNAQPSDAVKVPRLHDKDKFPELGDEEIVGPMSVAPAMYSPSRTKSDKKRSFFKFIQDLLAPRSHQSRVDATRA
ncbi:hypothetical protein VTN77DRAFT_1217 [Rasamsonia byssochlamydoides]|uniref:uncharacterized protein n=1 Tax=Rasamsonia byssochlamydoides TaxID=89139 RepID=UPI003742FF6B